MARQISYKTEAIILKSYDARECDRLYVIFSKEHGLMRVVGVGTRKPKAKLASGLEPLTCSELFLVGCRKLDKVTGVIVHDQFAEIRKSLESIVAVKRVFAIVEALAPEMESAGEIYQQLLNFLKIQDGQLSKVKDADNNQKMELLQMAMIWKTIQWAGYESHLFHCSNCRGKLQENNEYSFFVPEGIVCSECLQSWNRTGKMLIAKDTVKLLRLFLQKDLDITLKIKAPQKIFLQLQRVTKMMVACVTRKGNIL